MAALPCVIREATEAGAFADALVENLVRKDLTRHEVMDAIKALKDEYGWSVREIGRRTGRDHKDLSELIRIAEDPEVASLVAEELITPDGGRPARRGPEPRTARPDHGAGPRAPCGPAATSSARWRPNARGGCPPCPGMRPPHPTPMQRHQSLGRTAT